MAFTIKGLTGDGKLPSSAKTDLSTDITTTGSAVRSALDSAGLGQVPDTAVAALVNNNTSTTVTALASRFAARSELGAQALATFGDSITAAGQGGGIKWHELVSDWLGIPAYNPSVPGESPADIATRQGGLAPALTLTGNSIPAATTPVTATGVTPSTGWITASPGNASRGVFVGRLQGVPGTLAHDQSTGAWTFTRTTAGTVAIPCPPGSIFRVDASKAHRGSIQTFWAGRNGNTTVLRDTRSMVAYLTGPKRFLVLSILTGGADIPGTGGYTSILERNAQLATEWPSNYLDMRRYLIDQGLTAAGVTPTAQDTTDIANDTVPASLRDDNIHPNALGHWVIARKIAQEIVARGWVDPATALVPPAMAPETAPGNNLGLVLASATQWASATPSAGLTAAQDLSVRATVTPTAMGSTQYFVRRMVTTGDQRAWAFFMLGSGALRWQAFQTGTSAAVQTADSSVVLPFTGGTKFTVRVDHDSVARTVTFYTSTDNGATWSQLGTTKAITTGGIFATSTAPVEVGGPASSVIGSVQSVTIRSLDGATTYLDEDFTDGTATGWTLNGGATLG